MPGIIQRWKLFKQPTVVNVTVSGDASTQVLNYTARELYQTQDNLQAVVNFISNSLAQLPLKVYIRDGETERRRDRESDAALLLWRPNEDQTSFEFVRALAIEYLVFGTVYVWILPDLESESGYQLRILPSNWIVGSESDNSYSQDMIRICNKQGGTAVDVPRSEFVQFKMYSAGNPGGYISPIAALRQTLQEQIEAGRFRRQLWRSSGRLNAQIIRPKDVAPWDDKQRENFITAFREAWGAGGSKAGSIPLMEDGMEIKPFSTSFKESEWADSVKLSREAVAAAYGINPSLIWHSNTQTYASAKDNARALYADCLGPIIQMFQQRINSFLLPKIGADPRTYVEFDLEEKLKGSFEERAQIMQSSVGAPWLTRNEARAYSNLPPIEGGDLLITPLNVIEGGQASPNSLVDNSYDYPAAPGRPSNDDSEKATVVLNPSKEEAEKMLELLKNMKPTVISSECSCGACKSSELRLKGISSKEDDEKVQAVLVKFFNRQAKSVLPKIGADKDDWWDSDRWNAELAEDLLPVLTSIADAKGKETADELDWEWSEELTRAYLETAAKKRSERINSQTLKRLLLDLESEEPDPAHVFEVRSNTADVLGRAAATFITSWAVREAAHQAESAGAPSIQKKIVYKQWITGENARPSHQMMGGEMVPIDAEFSNGQFWPGDSDDPDESCGCNCSTEVVIK